MGCTVSSERLFGQQELTLSKATFTTRPSSVHSSAVACWVMAWHAHRDMSTAATLPASPAHTQAHWQWSGPYMLEASVSLAP